MSYSCIKGKKRSPNQDDFFLYADPNAKILGVFDGHGQYGHICSNLTQKLFLRVFINLNYIQILF